jgi:2-polyprenyl-3-methyl-5-hydroxy-6-metoxy-1,4-benzoquinol methylase
MMANINCDICGRFDVELLYQVPECTGMYSEVFNLVRCKNCGLVYVNPRPPKEEMYKYYPQESYYTYQSTKDRRVSFKNSIKYFLIEWAGGYRAKNGHKSHVDRFTTSIIRAVTKNLIIGIIPYRKGGKLLDIGCGKGDFLKWHKEHSWDVKGVEINEEAVNLCRQSGIEVFHGELLDAGFDTEVFDAITLVQVLEHIPNPSAVLSEVHRILKKDGLLFISVPNFGCFDRRVFGAEWVSLDIPRHIYHFEYATLAELLRKSGFRIVNFKAKVYESFSMRKSLRLISEQSYIRAIKAILKLMVLKPASLMISSRRKEDFAVYLALYCEKVQKCKS